VHVRQVVIDKPGEGGFGSIGRTRGDAPDIDCLVRPLSLPPHMFSGHTNAHTLVA